MNAEFFVLAFTAALNPKLLAIDLLLIENRRPRAMFLCVLLGGMTVGITIGLLDVLVFHLDAISSQKTVSASVDLGLGLLLLAVGALVATGRLHARRKAAAPAGVGQPGTPEGQPVTPEKEKKDGWAQLLAEPRLGLAMLVGAVCGIPGASYLTGLHILITSKASTANQVATPVPSSSAAATAPSSPATAGLRRHQRQVRSSTPTGRATTGCPAWKRARSSASSRALA